MQISFPILEYLDYHPNISAQSHQKPQEISIEAYEKQVQNTQMTYAAIFGIFILGLIMAFFIESSVRVVGFLLLSMLVGLIKKSISSDGNVLSTLYDIFAFNNTYYDTSAPKYMQNGKITFEAEGIRVAQKNQEVLYKYKEMASLDLFYFGMSLSDESKLNCLKWAVGNKEHEYLFLIGTYYSRNQLIYALKHLYQKGIPIKEWSEYGESLHLLSLPEKTEPPKKEIDKKIDEKYLRMIDDIGKNEEDEGEYKK